ncbi:MAG: TIGR00289 family protein, partial [Thermoplasmata archaeon HGW-Thermoplasmata-1]
MRVASLFSGGKDSVYATYVASMHGWDVVRLVTLVSDASDSWMFHKPNVELAPALADCMGIPILMQPTAGEKESELGDMKAALSYVKGEDKIEGVISGALASEYQRVRIEKVCHELGLKSFTPLWHKEQELILRELVAAGFDVRIV